MKCLRVEHLDIERVVVRIAVQWHDVGAKPRLAATLFELNVFLTTKALTLRNIGSDCMRTHRQAEVYLLDMTFPRRHRTSVLGRHILRGAVSPVTGLRIAYIRMERHDF